MVDFHRASICPVRGSQPGAQAVRHALEGQGKWGKPPGRCPELAHEGPFAVEREHVDAQKTSNLNSTFENKTAALFRQCLGCGRINLVKGVVFECAVCGSALAASGDLSAVGIDT
jgi:hypothetical protein